jgi:hypothetical protein
MMNSYLNLEKDPATGQFHPLLSGFEDANRIVNGVHRVITTSLNDGHTVASPLTVVPSYPDLPMEEVFPRPTDKKDPGVYLRELGEGRVVYFPWDVDRTFWEILNVDHAKLLRNAVLWATNEPQPLSVKGQGVLDVSIWSQQRSMTVHLVNLTNPMMMKGPVREIIPIGRQQVRIRVPQGKRIAKTHLLVAKQEIAFREQGGYVEMEIPTIGLHEVIALDFTA